MIQTIAFLLLTLLSAIALLVLFILLICQIAGIVRKQTNSTRAAGIKKWARIFILVMILNIGLVAVSQFTATTPAIRDETGHIPVNSVAELTQLELNGRKQWISIRGADKDNPVLFFLAGGPGGTQIAAVRHELAELEKHFVVVGWDQPGSGKSYDAQVLRDITVETYIQDGYALSEYLSERFGQEKIYLVGESWGSALGVFLIDRHPDSYYALIGAAQMIDFAQTERLDYIKAMEIAKDRQDADIIKKLESNGTPPYYGKNVTWKSAVYLNYLTQYMSQNPEIDNPGYDTLRDIFSSEYGLLDKVNFARGIINTFNHVFQQLYDIDLRTDYTKLDVPIYFFHGKHDVNAPLSLVEEYFQTLDAPRKEIVVFEHSGHSPWINETDKFVEELLVRFSVNELQK